MNSTRIRLTAFAALLVLTSAFPCSASLIGYDVDFNLSLNQTGPSAISLAGAFFASRGDMAAVGDFDGGTLTYPGPGSPAPFTVNPSSATELIYQTGFFASGPALDLAFPFGTYTINATNSGNAALNQSDSVARSADFYTGDTPSLNAATYNGLQGLQAFTSFNIGFPAFTPAAGTDVAFTFFTITNANTGAVVFNQGFLPPTTVGVALPANTLSPNTAYDYDLDYSDRITASGSTAPTNQLFDIRTNGSFTTASANAPEPGAATLVVLAVLGIAGLRTRKRSGNRVRSSAR
jgi:hypothetical protein